MRSCFFLAVVVLAGVCAGSEKKPPLLPCPAGMNEAACNPSRQDLKDAKAAFARGLKLQQKSPEAAYQEFERAAQLVPRNVEYLTAHELAKQQLVSRDLQRGNEELESGNQIEALADFRGALQLDPSNEFAQQRLRDAVGSNTAKEATGISIVEQSPELQLFPGTNRASFHFRGDNRELLGTIARAYGVSAQVEDTVTSKRVTFDIDDIDFYQAMNAVGQVTKTFWMPLDAKQMLIAPDMPDNHRQYDRYAMRTFYVPAANSTPTALNDVMNALRNLFEIRFVTPNIAASTLRRAHRQR